MPNLQEEMQRVKSKVDSLILEELLPASSPIPEIDLLYRMMRDYPARPAKGLRPFLCVATCRAMGGSEDDALLTASCIEMFQHWILIHDDIEDGSDLRRGQPTLHRMYGDPLALNAGDALHARMWGALVSNARRLGEARALGIMTEFSTMVDETTEGQHMELSWVREGRWDLSEHDYYEMCARKTSWYTAAGPCRLGAIVAGAGEAELARLLEFGTKMGVGFQIQDDALNLTGDPRKYGKASTDDILEGKRTLILLRLLGLVTRDEKGRLVSVMAKSRDDKTPADVEYVLSLVKKYDTIGYAQKRAKELIDEALVALRAVDWKGDRDSFSLLEAAARFAVERNW
ncbi:MAG TPA: polyprenyl synthetase family protein [Nitrososphaerales archaeon]|nr:polyprenyl synthetase family protein [Nitrososphaerales archaeon]